jgi:hypothetical protein
MPRDPENAQSGLDVLLEPIARGLGARFSKFFYMNVYDESDIEFPNFFKNIAVEGKIPKIFESSLGKYTPILNKDETSALDKLSVMASKTTAILFIVGADIRLIARAKYFAKKNNCSYHIYFIDDPKSSLLIKRGGYIRYIFWQLTLRVFVKNAGCVFSHTKNHVKALTTEFGRPVTELPLPWYSNQHHPWVRQESNSIDRIFYLGSINYLYKDNLLSLYDAIKVVNGKTGTNIELVTTAKLFKDDATKYRCVRLTADEIRVEVSNARHCILVYSFQKKYRNIVANSFPSKIFQYIPNAASIIYYGPESHMLADLASQSDGYIIYVKSRGELEQLISQKRYSDTVPSHIKNKFVRTFMYRYSLENFTNILNLSKI